MNNNIKIVSVDSGKHRTKAVLLKDSQIVDRFSINTKASEYHEEKSLTSSAFAVKVGQKTLLVGDQSASFDSSTSKALDLHRFATLLAISKLVENGDEISLTVGCPINLYLNAEKRKDYLRFMAGITAKDDIDFKNLNLDLSFSVDGKPFSVKLRKLFVIPESSGFLIKYEQDYLGSDVAIVDIGGLNVNGAIYQTATLMEGNEEVEYMQMLDSSHFTLEDGGNIFSIQLMDRLNSEYDAGIGLHQMKKIIKDGFIKYDKEGSARIISDEKVKFFKNIVSQMQSRKWSLKTLDFIFVGGGSLLFKNDILEILEFKDAHISETAEYDNAEGGAFLAEDAIFLENAA
ncbi:hypothetical protein ACOMCU_01890 [Lysinibacillus sp. UGB7]|uniref:ParM/StbA family protein n=1 Tax=Lysinibacillus sp. UGB7 TaxID=3411039 RepID=UPI003B7D7617